MATMKTLWVSLALLSVLLVAVQGQRDCTPADFTILHPESPIYSVLEQNVSLRAFIPDTTIILYKGLETTTPNRINCAVSKCSLDTNSGELTFHNFQPSNASNYTMLFTKGVDPTCVYRFALVKAVAPSLSETQLNYTIDKDSGELSLQPMVSPGIPPAEVHWYLNDQNISVGNTFTFDSPPVASDRGIYTANISNLAGSASLSYTITVRFDPIITLEITETTATDYIIHCRAIAYPQIETIELFEIRPDGTLLNLHLEAGATSTTSNQLSSNLDYEGTATFAGTENCPKNYRCRVSTSYSNGINNTGTCLTSKYTCTHAYLLKF
ncbi:PREDICTED: uncharacterized protein LOC109582229 [Amphimedon queenslandica]|uniref:Ig-like domain-containing protein n=1 Tax=Amphimedon queenslandica TaxID=400682 RepID=A0AAN0J6Q7_AMPQE|nr:PREDICTED: uncharacterized protein LOC109582229 [Amphimedon queenslandica]|eukprot:XP_019852442.1 PREDICTED: uncharacterized protein LOC109582229 [Amphimedon queenslandica]